MEEQKLQGKNFLKVCGIIMIVGGALGLIVSIVAILGVAGLAYLSDGQLEMGMLYASSILALVAAAVQLVTGIVGVKNCKKPEKAFYDKVFALVGEEYRGCTLMVGDSLSSDMQGGRNAGIPTCFYGKRERADARCDYVIEDLLDLLPLLEAQ